MKLAEVRGKYRDDMEAMEKENRTVGEKNKTSENFVSSLPKRAKNVDKFHEYNEYEDSEDEVENRRLPSSSILQKGYEQQMKSNKNK